MFNPSRLLKIIIRSNNKLKFLKCNIKKEVPLKILKKKMSISMKLDQKLEEDLVIANPDC